MKSKNFETVNIVKDCRHDFTDEELLSLMEEMAVAHDEQAQAESRMKSVVATLKAEVESARAKLSVAAQKIKARHEYRPCECEQTKDFDSGTLTIIRLDTGDVVESRKLDVYERQTKLSGVA